MLPKVDMIPGAAADKMSGRAVDMIVVNDISRKDIGMESDFNEAGIIVKWQGDSLN